MMTLVDTKVSVHEGISGHFEASVRSEVAAPLDHREKATDRPRNVRAWRIRGTNSAALCGERESAFPVAQTVSGRAARKQFNKTPSGDDRRGATCGSSASRWAGVTSPLGQDRDQASKRAPAPHGPSGLDDVTHRAGVFAPMIGLAAGTRIWIVAGGTGKGPGFVGLI